MLLHLYFRINTIVMNSGVNKPKNHMLFMFYKVTFSVKRKNPCKQEMKMLFKSLFSISQLQNSHIRFGSKLAPKLTNLTQFGPKYDIHEHHPT